MRLGLVVAEDGTVAEVRLRDVALEGAGAVPPAVFSDVALSFAKGLSFAPAVGEDGPVAVEIEYLIHFREPAGVPPDTARAEPPGAGEEPQPSPRANHREAPPTGMPGTQQDRGGDLDEPLFEASVTDRRLVEPVAAGDFIVDPRAFAEVPRRNAEQMLTLVPGILLRNHQGEGHASTIFLRGFDAGEGQDIEILLEGMPLNEVSNPHGHGYADTHFIIPELVTGLRVLEGPFDPGQGDFAVAGSAAWTVGLPERGIRLQAGLGSYDEKELLVLWGPEGEKEGTFAGVRWRKGDGFGINRAFSAATAMTGYELDLKERTRLRLVGFAHATRFDSAGVVRADDVEAGRLPCGTGADDQFFCTADPNQGGSGSRVGLLGILESRSANRRLSQSVWLTSRRLVLQENFTGTLHDEQRRGDGTEAIYGATTFGLKGTLGFGWEALGHNQRFELGYDVRHDEGESILRRLRIQGGDPYERVFDNEIRITHVGTWGGARLRGTDWLELRAGLRLDAFYFQVVDRNLPAESRVGPRETSETIAADGLAVQPRLGLRLTLLEGLDWITSFGVGVRSSDAAALADGEFAPFARVRALESGWVAILDGTLPTQLRLLGFLTHVDRDLVFDERVSRNVFVGSSNRYGALLAAKVEAGRWLDAQGSLTWTEAHLADGDGGFFSFDDGPRLPWVPRWVGRLDVAARETWTLGGLDFPTRGGVGLTWVAPRPLPLEQFGESQLTVDLGATVRHSRFELGLEVLNVFDARLHQAEFHHASHFGRGTPSRIPVLHFAAAPPRTFFLTFAVILDVDTDV